MALQIHLSKTQISDLKAILELGPKVLDGVVQAINRLESPPLTPSGLKAVIGEVVRENPVVVDSIVRLTLWLSSLRMRRKMSAVEVVEALLQGAKTAAPGESDPISWSQIEPALGALIASAKIQTTAKALELSYDYTNLLQTTKIITDIRPIYDDELDRIDGAVVSFTLRLSYDSREGNHALSVAMDQADVETLREQCVRALKKSALAREAMVALKIPVAVAGSENR